MCKLYILVLVFFANCGNNGNDYLQSPSSLQKPDSRKQDTKNSQDKKKSEQNENMKPEKTIIEVRNTNNKGEKNTNNESTNNDRKIEELEKIIKDGNVSTQEKSSIEKLINELKKQQKEPLIIDKSNNIQEKEKDSSPVKDNDSKNDKKQDKNEEENKDKEQKIDKNQEYINKICDKLYDLTSLRLNTENLKNTVDIKHDPFFNAFNMYIITNKNFEGDKLTIKKLLEKIKDIDDLARKISNDDKLNGKYNKKYNLKIDQCHKCKKIEDCECETNTILTETLETIQNFKNNYKMNKEKYQKLSIEYQRAIIVKIIHFVDLLFDKFKFFLFQRVDGYNNDKITDNTKNFKIEDNIGGYADIELQNKIDNSENGLTDKKNNIRGEIYRQISKKFTIEDLKKIEDFYFNVPEITDFVQEIKIENENKYQYYFDFSKIEKDKDFIKNKYLIDIKKDNELTKTFNDFLKEACLNKISDVFSEKLKLKNKNKYKDENEILQFNIRAKFAKHFVVKE